MKVKTKHIGSEALGLFLIIGFSTNLFSHFLVPIDRNGYILPNQSSMYTFQVTNANRGSDAYAFSNDDQIRCNDLLSTYAKKPDGLEFVKCERPKNSQTKIKVTYRVNGDQSQDIEDFLVENYGMGELRWTCCGWDNGGKYGMFEHAEFEKIDPNCSGIINMFAPGEVSDKNEPTGFKLETDRNKIDYFTVIVALVVV